MTAESVWNNCLNFIKDNIQLQAYKTWFEPIKPVKLDNNVLSVQVPSKFFYEWLEEHYIKLLRVALVRQLGNEAKLIYDVKMENNYSSTRPQIVKFPSSNRDPLKPQKVSVSMESNKRELRNPFVIPGIRNIKIADEMFVLYPKHFMKLCELIIDRGYDFNISGSSIVVKMYCEIHRVYFRFNCLKCLEELVKKLIKHKVLLGFWVD